MLSQYSHSSLETFRKCPRQFKFRYIDSISREKKKNAPAIMGGIVHRGLEQLYKLGADGIILPKEDLKKLYKDEWNKLPIESIIVESSQHTIDDYIRIGEEILLKYYDKFKPFNQTTLLGTELKISFTLPGTNFKFNCRIDRLSKRDDGTIEIYDYKTGQHLARVNDLSYQYQMGLYLLSVMENFPDFKNIELVLYSLRHEEAVRCQMNEEMVDVLIEELKQDVVKILDAVKMNNFPVKESPLCNYCDYYEICPAKIHKLMLEDEEKTHKGEISPEKIKELADEYIQKNLQSRVLKDEMESLKVQLIEISKQYQMSSFEGDEGKVNLKLSKDSKFITKTENQKAFSELSFICREAGMEEFFKLDVLALMKEGVKKDRVDSELMERLQEFIKEKESARFFIKKKADDDKKEDIIY